MESRKAFHSHTAYSCEHRLRARNVLSPAVTKDTWSHIPSPVWEQTDRWTCICQISLSVRSAEMTKERVTPWEIGGQGRGRRQLL